MSFLYMFRATMCPSSGEITVSMRHLVLVTLCGGLSGMQCAYQTVIINISWGEYVNNIISERESVGRTYLE